ncbi:hypothetical protein SDC9_159980 [bioreactor metagenome]|uniref:Uncharacterized protein n=1 Tax=bioreactor metagenome TaxID=1076179 RepID=A0A645FE52_9ZZZZ
MSIHCSSSPQGTTNTPILAKSSIRLLTVANWSPVKYEMPTCFTTSHLDVVAFSVFSSRLRDERASVWVEAIHALTPSSSLFKNCSSGIWSTHLLTSARCFSSSTEISVLVNALTILSKGPVALRMSMSTMTATGAPALFSSSTGVSAAPFPFVWMKSRSSPPLPPSVRCATN